MIAETVIKAVAETAAAKSEIAVVDKAGVEKLAPVEVVGVGPLKISAIVENIPLVEEHARFFSAPEFKEMTITDLPDVQGIRIELNGEFIDIPLAEGTVLDAVGVRDLIAYAMDPAIEQFIQLRLEELARKSGEVVDPATGDVGSSEGLIYQPRYPDLYHTIVNGFRESLGYPPIEAPPELPDGAITIISSDVPVFPSPLIIASPLSQFGDLLQKLESAVADRLPEGTCLTAKRIDYLVGDQYVAGHLAELPILGGVSDIVFKGKLGEAVTKEDWIEVAGDVMVIAPIAVAPFLPLTGVAAIAGWGLTSATFQGLAFGLTELAKGGHIGEVSEQAGKGALIGAITGVVGGVAVAKLMPAIASPLLSHVAAGSLTGTAATTTEAIIHVIEKGANLEEAAKEIGLAALEGATIGGGVGGLGLGVSKIVGKLAASPKLTPVVNEGLARTRLKECLYSDRISPYIKDTHELAVYTKHNLQESLVLDRPCLQMKINPLAKDAMGRTNLERTSAGRSAIDINGDPVNLHHIGQKIDSPLAELPDRVHKEFDAVLHDKSIITEVHGAGNNWNEVRAQYWQERSKTL